MSKLIWFFKLLTQLNHLQIAETPLIDNKSHQCAYAMKALFTSSTRINMEHGESSVVLHLENMGMATNKELWRTGEQRTAHRRVVMAWVASDMLDKHLGSLHFEAQRLRKAETKLAAIDVAINRTQGAESSQTVGHFNRPYIARMPYLVTRFKMTYVAFVPIAMCITQ